jgi:ADP-ribose diphosphatase
MKVDSDTKHESRKSEVMTNEAILCEGTYFSIRINELGEFVHNGNEVLVVPLTEQREVILTEEPSTAFGEPVLVVPGGETEPDEEHGETAIRELREEIGLAPGKLAFLGELRPFSKYFSMRSFIYLAQDLSFSPLPGDEGYPIRQEKIPLASFETLIQTGRLQDARVIAALYLARAFLEEHRTENKV